MSLTRRVCVQDSDRVVGTRDPTAPLSVNVWVDVIIKMDRVENNNNVFN